MDEQLTKQPFKSPNCVDKIISNWTMLGEGSSIVNIIVLLEFAMVKVVNIGIMLDDDATVEMRVVKLVLAIVVLVLLVMVELLIETKLVVVGLVV